MIILYFDGGHIISDDDDDECFTEARMDKTKSAGVFMMSNHTIISDLVSDDDQISDDGHAHK